VKGKKSTMSVEPILTVLVKVLRGNAREGEKRFTSTFSIGRTKECDLQIKDDCISRRHLQVIFDGRQWRLKDLGSFNGTFLNGERIQEAALPDYAEIELGSGGPLLALIVGRPQSPKIEEALSTTPDYTSETQIIKHYFDQNGSENIGEQTMMFRRAFERAHKKKSKKYIYGIGAVVGMALVIALVATGVIHYQKEVIARQKNKIESMQKTAENIFYAMKSLEVQIGQLEDIVLSKADPEQIKALLEKRKQLTNLAKQYDNFIIEIGVYKKIPVEKQIILKMARIFGECDVNVPDSFVKEVMRYIGIWKETGLIKSTLSRAESKGYPLIIIRVLKENNLPPHFLYLALRESDLNPMAIGKITRYGCAKGMWQFIPVTAQHYGLRIGPRYQERVYDPYDERFYFEKATKAAAKYLRDINNTEAQASGLLVMASYNWGENNIREIINKMPENPRDRNFWRLLKTAKIPRETYDYVLSIFSAAVICENPRLFGLDFDPPHVPAGTQ
jgi:membrane-bound lytic murein transglycosylase D